MQKKKKKNVHACVRMVARRLHGVYLHRVTSRRSGPANRGWCAGSRARGDRMESKKNMYIFIHFYVCIFLLAASSEAAVRLAATCRVPLSEPSSSFQPLLISPHHLSSVCLPGSIAIIVPLVLLVILIVTVVVGVYICRRRQR